MQCNRVQFLHNRLYLHKYLQINFTMYDAQHSQDSVNPRTHPNIMMLNETNTMGGANAHPYCYAHVLAILHAVIFIQHQGEPLGKVIIA